jgi:hypothetical protein
MFVERKVRYSYLFTNLVGWHTGIITFPLSYIILAQLASPLSDVVFCLHSEKHWLQLVHTHVDYFWVLPKWCCELTHLIARRMGC